MNLLKITTNEANEQLVSARELHKALEVKTRFSLWVEQNFKNFKEARDFSSVVTTTQQNQYGGTKEIQDYALVIDMAKHIAMMAGTSKGFEIRDYFIEIENKYKQSQLDTTNLSPELQMFNGLFQSLAKQELATKNLATKIDNISDIVALNTTDWRKDSQKLIRRMAQNQGGFGAYQEINNLIYEETERRAGANLKQRLTNKRRRMADEGMSVSARNKLNKLDVINDDKRILEVYMAVVKDFAIKHGVEIEAEIKKGVD